MFTRALLALLALSGAVSAKQAPGALKVSSDGRFLIKGDGSFFFYLGDTAWELFHRLNLEETNIYLLDRSAKGFTVIQAVILAELDGLGMTSACGHKPLLENDPMRPNEAYFLHVDKVVKRANSLGLTMGLLPTWGDKVGPIKWGRGPQIFNPENAHYFGEFLGKRYRRSSVIWILGGDRVPETEEQRETWRAMAAGLRRGAKGRHLITYHPWGATSSGEFLHDEKWLDFNMFQSGHGSRKTDNAIMLDRDYARSPAKPCLDGEPAYEDHPVDWKSENGYFDDSDVRRQAYRSLFAGAFGHTYGCHPVWQFHDSGREPVSAARRTWRDALSLPGASQMRFARALIESRPPLKRIPDNGILARDPGKGSSRPRACRAKDGIYAFVYLPEGGSVEIRMESVSSDRARAWWYDPRTGGATLIGDFPTAGEREFSAPTSGAGSDWILVLDETARTHLPPGQGQ